MMYCSQQPMFICLTLSCAFAVLWLLLLGFFYLCRMLVHYSPFARQWGHMDCWDGLYYFPLLPSVILLDLFHITLYHWCRHHITVQWHGRGLSSHTFRILLWGWSRWVRWRVEVFSHLRYGVRAVRAMFSCFSDTSLSLPSELITAALQPCPPTPSEYNRPHSPLHFQNQCVGAHNRSPSSEEHLHNGLLLIYKDFVPKVSQQIYFTVHNLRGPCNIHGCTENGWKRHRIRLLSAGGSVHSSVISSSLLTMTTSSHFQSTRCYPSQCGVGSHKLPDGGSPIWTAMHS